MPSTPIHGESSPDIYVCNRHLTNSGECGGIGNKEDFGAALVRLLQDPLNFQFPSPPSYPGRAYSAAVTEADCALDCLRIRAGAFPALAKLSLHKHPCHEASSPLCKLQQDNGQATLTFPPVSHIPPRLPIPALSGRINQDADGDCATEQSACMADTNGCLACFIAIDESCNDNPTDCSGLNDAYCCAYGEECSKNAALISYIGETTCCFLLSRARLSPHEACRFIVCLASALRRNETSRSVLILSSGGEF